MKKYILTGVRRGTKIASSETMNCHLMSEAELLDPDFAFMVGADQEMMRDLIFQADKNTKTFWISQDDIMFMLKKV